MITPCKTILSCPPYWNIIYGLQNSYLIFLFFDNTSDSHFIIICRTHHVVRENEILCRPILNGDLGVL